MRRDLEAPAQAYPVRWETPSSSKAQRWMGVGVMMTVRAGRLPASWMRLAAMVVRSSSMVANWASEERNSRASRTVALAGQRHPPPVRAGSYLRGDAGDPAERRQPS